MLLNDSFLCIFYKAQKISKINNCSNGVFVEMIKTIRKIFNESGRGEGGFGITGK